MLTPDDYKSAAIAIGCEAACIIAVDRVESGGQGFLPDGSGRLTMLFEPHVFWRQLKKFDIDPAKVKAQYPYLVNATWDPNLYAQGGTSHEKFEIATTIHQEAAYRSASYGRYQILGENYHMVGFGSAVELVAFLKASERNHLLVFVRYIVAAGLGAALKAKNFDAFAEGYNGKAYRKDNYAVRMQNAYNAAPKIVTT